MAANKPILEIEVNDQEFRRFYELFSEYREQLADMPDAWKEIDAAMGDASKSLGFGALSARDALAMAAAQAGIISEALRDAVKHSKSLGDATSTAGRGMDGLRRSAEGVSRAISGAWSMVIRLGAIGGLGAIFGGFGIGELAGAGFSRFKAAGQLGISPGLLASFQANAQQFLPSSALGAAANAQNDISKAGYLAALGISYSSAQGMNPSDLAFEELRRARAAYIANPALAMQSPAIQSYLALGGNLEDVRNAAQQPLSELNRAQRETNANVAALNFSRETGQEWTDLKKKLDMAQKSIETSLIEALHPLAPEIGTLADEISDFIKTFVNEKDFKIVIADVKGGLHEMGDFLERVDWKKIGDEITWLANKLGWLIPKNDGKPSSDNGPITSAGQAWKRWKDGDVLGPLEYAGSYVRDVFKWITSSTPSDYTPKNNPLDVTSGSVGKNLLFRQYSSEAEGIRGGAKLLANYPKNWNADTLSKIIPIWDPEGVGINGVYVSHVEKWSGVPRNLPMSKWTRAQFAAVVSAMSRQEGTDVVTPDQVAAALFGAPNKAKAMGNLISLVDVDIQKHGKNWFRYLPANVAAFVGQAHLSKAQQTSTDIQSINKTLRAVLKQRSPKPAHVAVTNSTSARVAVSLNAAIPS